MMNNLVTFPNSRKAKEEAAEWLVCMDEGLSREDRVNLYRWLEAHPSHGALLVEMAKHWDDQAILAELSEASPLSRYRSRKSRPIYWKRAAAVCAGLCVLAMGWAYVDGHLGANSARPELIDARLSTDREPGTPADASKEYETAVGEQLSVQLADGSVILLNTDTLIDVRYSRSERTVFLERGEASFNVAHYTARPFRVHAGSRIIEAVGTVFNVQLGPDDLELTVSEGIVQVTHDRSTSGAGPSELSDMRFSAGEVAVIAGRELTVRDPDPAELEAKLSWQHGTLVFRGETLEEVLAEVERYTDVTFTIADDSIRDIRVGGRFRSGDVDGLLVALRESFGVEPRNEDGVITLSAR